MHSCRIHKVYKLFPNTSVPNRGNDTILFDNSKRELNDQFD